MKSELEKQSLSGQVMKRYSGYRNDKIVIDFLIVFKLCIEVNEMPNDFYKNDTLSTTNGFRRILKDKNLMNHVNYIVLLKDILKYT